ncbi:MAG TPA: KpsF/GutQ family sugar-phosphate isomerase [Candidatus Thioglobus sp.]|nr:KpsF/GutQ family sugar-phosphate isomerase [Candidatus Thioglobus sp.]HIL21572.1 KpsF/GutQ family sugar-phosphate isomerase [Candidatus Thioglobus sp.]
MTKALVEIAKTVIQSEADSIVKLKDRVDQNFVDACILLQACQGKVVLIGMGKSGHIARKIAATLASTGTPAFFVHPGEAGHGDLGMIDDNDVVILVSYSGEAEEISQLLPSIHSMGAQIISMTGNSKSTLALASNTHLDVSVAQEACPHNLTPTSSTTVALVMGDALAITLLNARGFTPQDFARSHPSGALGRRLLTLVSTIMKSGSDTPIVAPNMLLLDALLVMSEKALGMVLIAESDNTLLGIFTDGDLRRVLENNTNISVLSIGEVMTIQCQSIEAEKPAMAAVEMMDEHNLNSLPVVNTNNKIVGAINMHTLMQAKIV